jgi:hypothetical protein
MDLNRLAYVTNAPAQVHLPSRSLVGKDLGKLVCLALFGVLQESIVVEFVVMVLSTAFRRLNLKAGTTDRDYISANRISPETETFRCNMLRSLTTAMAELQNLEFDKIGTHLYRWNEPYEDAAECSQPEEQVYTYGPFESSKEFMTAELEAKWFPVADLEEENIQGQNMVLGIRKILDTFHATPTISLSSKDSQGKSEKETFVLSHPALDFQNILTDNDGNVPGIIDWEGCMTVPRCVSYSSFPDFLRRDWTTNFSLRKNPHMSFRLNHYRRVYANTMLVAGCADAKYTRKSAMYRAIVDAVNNDDNNSCSAPDLITKMIAQMPDLNTCDLDEFEEALGEGWGEAEEFLQEEIARLVDPEL